VIVRAVRRLVVLISLTIVIADLAVTGPAAASSGFHLVTGRGYSFQLPAGWSYWRREMGANWIEYFYRDPAIPWSAMTIEPDGCSCCLRDTSTDRLDLESALGPIVTNTDQLSPDRLAFAATIDPDPLPDNGLVIAIPPVTQGCVRTWWRVDVWLPAQDHGEATVILNSVRVTA
jgi:hypothetical protein